MRSSYFLASFLEKCFGNWFFVMSQRAWCLSGQVSHNSISQKELALALLRRPCNILKKEAVNSGLNNIFLQIHPVIQTINGCEAASSGDGKSMRHLRAVGPQAAPLPGWWGCCTWPSQQSCAFSKFRTVGERWWVLTLSLYYSLPYQTCDTSQTLAQSKHEWLEIQFRT